MPEKREWTQLPGPKSTTLSSHLGMGRVVRWFVGLRGASLASHLRNPPTLAVLPAGIGLAVPHAIVPVSVSAVVAGLVTVITKYLVLYAKNRRARSIAAIRKAAMEKKITV